MEKTTVVKEFFQTQSDFVVFKNQLYSYNGRGRIYSKNAIMLEDFINDPLLFKRIITSDFNQFSVLSNYSFPDKSRENLIMYYSNRKEKFNDNVIFIYRQLSPNDIEFFYRLEVIVEIKGIRINPGRYSIIPQDYPDDIVILYLKPEERHIAKQEIIDPWDHRSSAYLVSISDIDKIIGVKRYRNIGHFNVIYEQEFTGETEEIVLDMHNFDEKVYDFFRQHDAFEIEWGT